MYTRKKFTIVSFSVGRNCEIKAFLRGENKTVRLFYFRKSKTLFTAKFFKRFKELPPCSVSGNVRKRPKKYHNGKKRGKYNTQNHKCRRGVAEIKRKNHKSDGINNGNCRKPQKQQ